MRTLLFTIVFLTAAIADSQILIQRLYFPWADSAGIISATGSKVTSDGGMIISGYVGGSTINSRTKPFLIKTNLNGDTLWMKTYTVENSFNSSFFSVDEISPGSYIACGSLMDSASGYKFSIVAAKIDAMGNAVWCKSYSLSSDETYLETAWSVKTVSGGGFIIAGNIFDSGYDAFLLRLDNSGNAQWSKIFKAANTDAFYSVTETTDGGFIAAGGTMSFNAGAFTNSFVVKTNASGDTLWTRNYKTAKTGISWCVAAAADGGCIIPVSLYNGETDMGAIRVSSSGETVWAKQFGGANTEYAYWADAQPDGSVVVAGGTFSNGDSTHGSSCVAKLNADGKLSWVKEYGGPSDRDEAYTIEQNSFGGFNIMGFSDIGNPFSSVYIISTDSAGDGECFEVDMAFTISNLDVQTSAAPLMISSGAAMTNRIMTSKAGGQMEEVCMLTSTGVKESASEIIVLPNPCAEYAVFTSNADAGNGTIKIYSLAGEKVKEISGIKLGENKIDLSEVESGIYFYRAAAEGKNLAQGKLLIVK